MGLGVGGAGVGLLMIIVWLVPLATLVITLLLGLRFVRATERVASAMESLARNNPPRP